MLQHSRLGDTTRQVRQPGRQAGNRALPSMCMSVCDNRGAPTPIRPSSIHRHQLWHQHNIHRGATPPATPCTVQPPASPPSLHQPEPWQARRGRLVAAGSLATGLVSCKLHLVGPGCKPAAGLALLQRLIGGCRACVCEGGEGWQRPTARLTWPHLHPKSSLHLPPPPPPHTPVSSLMMSCWLFRLTPDRWVTREGTDLGLAATVISSSCGHRQGRVYRRG
jgi:hypothetical protein